MVLHDESKFSSFTFALNLVTTDMIDRHMGKVNMDYGLEHIQCAVEIGNYNYVYHIDEMSYMGFF